MAAKEADALREILRYLKLAGIFHIRVNQGGVPLHDGSGRYRPGPTRGVSDVHIILDGKAGWIEVKSDKGRLSDAQAEFLAAVERAGGIAIVARSAKDVESVLGNL